MSKAEDKGISEKTLCSLYVFHRKCKIYFTLAPMQKELLDTEIQAQFQFHRLEDVNKKDKIVKLSPSSSNEPK